MMKRTLATMVGMITLVSACGSGHDMAADLAAISKTKDAYVAAVNSGNAAALGALFTADGHLMNNAQPTAVGPQGVETATAAMLAQMSSQNLVVTPEKTDVVGDVAYERGTYKTTLTPKSGPPTVEDGRYLVVLRRQADNTWKLVDDIGNLPTAPVAMAMAPAATKAPAKPTMKKK